MSLENLLEVGVIASSIGYIAGQTLTTYIMVDAYKRGLDTSPPPLSPLKKVAYYILSPGPEIARMYYARKR